MTQADPLAFLRVGDLGWDDLVLPDATVAELRALAAGAARGGLVAVVSGPAGVGKTLAVRTVAEQLRLDTWRVDCRLLVELHGRATPEALPGVVAVGERPHAVMLFHDAEWLFEPAAQGAGARVVRLGSGRLSPTVLETREPERLPGELAGLPHVMVPAPDAAARAELWVRLAWRAHPLAVLDVARLARVPVSGAVIEQALERVVEERGGREPDTERLLAVLADAAR